VRGEPRLDEVLNLARESIVGRLLLAQHDEGFHDLAADLVGLADHRRERHGGMADQAILDFTGAYTETRRRNHVVVAADERDEALVIDHALIAGRHPVADELVARRIRPLPVFQKHHRIGPLHRDLSDLARLDRIAHIVDDRDVVSRRRLTHRAGP
jgi:hypothetical protein